MSDKLKLPDIYPLSLKEGIELLKKNLIDNYTIVKTSAPGQKDDSISNKMRIIRLKVKADKSVEIVVCEK